MRKTLNKQILSPNMSQNNYCKDERLDLKSSHLDERLDLKNSCPKKQSFQRFKKNCSSRSSHVQSTLSRELMK